jgi:class 3 adenylate cyclase
MRIWCCSLHVVPLSGRGFDPEELATFQAEQLGACIDCCSDLGAHVAGVLGNRIVIHAGVAQASDTRLVLHTAWRLLEHVRARSERLESRHGVRLELRVGLDAGIVQVAQGGSLLGLTEARAAQLEQAGAAGAVLVSETIRQVAAEYAVFTPKGVLKLSGDHLPSAVYGLEEAA